MAHKGVKGEKRQEETTQITLLTLNLTKASDFTLDIELFPPLWGVSTSIEYVLVKFLHIYGTSTPCKDMRSTYQYTRGTKSWPAMQSQLHNHVEGLLKSQSMLQVFKQRVPLIAALPLSPPPVSRPSEGNSRFTSLSSVQPDIRKSVQLRAQMHSVQCAVCSVQCAQCAAAPPAAPQTLRFALAPAELLAFLPEFHIWKVLFCKSIFSFSFLI